MQLAIERDIVKTTTHISEQRGFQAHQLDHRLRQCAVQNLLIPVDLRRAHRAENRIVGAVEMIEVHIIEHRIVIVVEPHDPGSRPVQPIQLRGHILAHTIIDVFGAMNNQHIALAQ